MRPMLEASSASSSCRPGNAGCRPRAVRDVPDDARHRRHEAHRLRRRPHPGAGPARASSTRRRRWPTKSARRGERLHRPTLSAAAARGMALVLGARGELDAAMASAERAVESGHAASAFRSNMRAPCSSWASIAAAGEAAARAARVTSGARPSATFDALGADCAGRSTPPARLPVSADGCVDEGLTATEAQVAELVARGLTNKEVAAGAVRHGPRRRGEPVADLRQARRSVAQRSSAHRL